MRTLVYCTGYSRSLGGWDSRFRPWLDAIKRLKIADQILIVDDGSAALPGWDDLLISSGRDVERAAVPIGPDIAILHHFRKRLGRRAVWDCPGWYRSYAFGPAYALHHGFDRVVHVESDAYLLTERARNYVLGCVDGWISLWSEHYQFPELAIQLAAGNGLKTFYDFTRQSYDLLANQVHEYVLPFTHVERGLNGDRHGETNGPIPQGLDYVCQILPQREAPYYYWRHDGAAYRPDSLLEEEAIDYGFQSGGASDEIVGEGWSFPEDGFRWMTGFFSTLRLPPLSHSNDYVFRINVHPAIHGPIISQDLRLTLNNHPIARFNIDGDLILGTVLPLDRLRRDGTDVIGLIHPSGICPDTLASGSLDNRILSVAVRHVALVPIRTG